MFFRHLGLLIQKELQVFRNSYFGGPKKIFSTIGIGLVFVLIMFGVTAGLKTGFEGFLEGLPPAMEEFIFPFLLVIIFIWLSAVIFISVIVDSQNKFFKTADLEFLMASPISPALVFTFRFLVFILFSSTTLTQLLIFGFCPLIALGLVAGAPIQFFVFILPLAYLFLLIPATIGILLIMLLLIRITPKTIFRITGLFNIGLLVLWIYFIAGDQQRILASLIQTIENWDFLWDIFRPLYSAAEVGVFFLGYDAAFWRPFLELAIFSFAALGIAVFIIRRLYYPVYDRLQSFFIQEKKVQGGVEKGKKIPGIVITEWKIALRNYEMAQGALGMGSLLLAYYVGLYTVGPEGGVFLFLLNLGVVGFCISVMISVLLTPSSYLKDKEVLRRQNWLLKTSPLPAGTAVFYNWQAFFWLQIPAGIPALALAHWLAGLEWRLLFPGVVVFVIMQGAATLLSLLCEYAGYAWGKDVSPLIRLLKDLAPIIFFPVFLFFLGLGFFYERLAFLGFLHGWNQEWVFLLSGIILVLGILFLAVRGSKQTAKFWEQMEI